MSKLIIFVCSGNTCRSPMAEVLFKDKLYKNKIYNTQVISRGISVIGSFPAADDAIEVMKEYNCDLSNHWSTALSLDEALKADLLVCMTETHKNVLLSHGINPEKIMVLGVGDPYGKGLDQYRKSAAEIIKGLEKVYERIA